MQDPQYARVPWRVPIHRNGHTFYEPYTIHFSDILEIWRYAGSIETEEFEPEDVPQDNLKSMLQELKRDIGIIKMQPA